jgi:hypothetical protein
MGYYINPEEQMKEHWLQEQAVPIASTEVLSVFDSADEWPVCLVDNGLFTAAGIAYDKQEAEAFLQPDDRPKQWFKVKRSKLNQFLPVSMRIDA